MCLHRLGDKLIASNAVLNLFANRQDKELVGIVLSSDFCQFDANIAPRANNRALTYQRHGVSWRSVQLGKRVCF